MPDTPVTPQPMFEWHSLNPRRRPRPDNEVSLPEKPASEKSTLFSGIFRRKLAERYLNDLKEPLARLDKVLAKENHLAVVAAYYQLAVEAAVRIRRTDLVKEFEQERDRAILECRQAPKLKVYKQGSRQRKKA